MKDTLSAAAAGIPEAGIRVTLLVGVIVLLSVTVVLLYFKMKSADT